MSKYLRKFETEAEYSAATIYRPSVSLIEDTEAVIFDPKPHDYSEDYLTFRALEDGTFSFSGSSTANCLSYSTDSGATWSEPSSAITTSTLSSGDTVLWKGSGMSPANIRGIGTFSSTSQFEAEGNIMSLLFGDNFSGQTDLTGYNYAFYQLLGTNKGTNAKLVNVDNLILPATTLAERCYAAMFRGCTSLTTAPELPATTLKSSCYENMFRDCTSLTTAPELPATTLAGAWYSTMFYGCSGLTESPILPATTLKNGCYRGMFSGCTSLSAITCLATTGITNNTSSWVDGVAANGTFTKAASTSSWTTGVNGIPSGWTVVDYTE